MKIVLCGINAKYIHSNLAIYNLKSYAEKHCNTSDSFELREYTINHYVENILRDLFEAKPDLLVFSCYIWNIRFVRELSIEIKKVLPKLKIWLGGPEVSYHGPIVLKENPDIDLVMCGEGEKLFADAISQCRGDVSAFKGNLIPGLVYREGDQIVDGGFAALMDMDEVPFVYDDFDLFSHKIIYYESSRGCPFSCSYCLSSIDKKIRFRSIDLVYQELDRFLQAKVPQVKFVDRTFNCDKKRAVDIWNYIHNHDNGITNFHFEISSDLLDEEAFAVFEKMRPGLIQLEIGVQSTYWPTVTAIRRKMNLEKLFAHVDRVHSLGNIHQHLDLIAGLPEENLEHFKESFNDVYAHQPDQLQLGFLKVLHGTFMESKIEEYELQYRSNPPYEVLSTKWLSFEDVNTLKGVEELVEMYYNSGQYANILKYIIPYYASAYEFYQKFSDYYQGKEYQKQNHNRLKKYDILREFLFKDAQREQFGEQADIIQRIGEEFLILDLYLRENVKSRPNWSKTYSVKNETLKEWYRNYGHILFPAQKESYDSRKAANKSHIEAFSFDVEAWMKEGKLLEKACYVLFDYDQRNPLNGNCRIFQFRNIEEFIE